MNCYMCDDDCPAVAVCQGCGVALCRDHLDDDLLAPRVQGVVRRACMHEPLKSAWIRRRRRELASTASEATDKRHSSRHRLTTASSASASRYQNDAPGAPRVPRMPAMRPSFNLLRRWQLHRASLPWSELEAEASRQRCSPADIFFDRAGRTMAEPPAERDTSTDDHASDQALTRNQQEVVLDRWARPRDLWRNALLPRQAVPRHVRGKRERPA